MIIDLTIVIPYYNESKTIIKTLDMIANQSYSPKEVILVNSSSTDNTSTIIDEWIKEKEKEKENDKIQFKNIHKNTFLPSSSKNIGVKYSNSEYVAFMDCGLLFDNSWIEMQYNKILNYKFDVIFGTVELEGDTNFDVCCVSQTYGYKKISECIPGTLLRKSVFNEIGKFEEFRAGYDPFWRQKVKKANINYFVPRHRITKYDGINYASNFSQLISKTIQYTHASESLIKSYKNNFLLLIVFLLFCFVIMKPLILPYLFVFYLICRGYIFPIIKSWKITSLLYSPNILLGLPIVGILIDSAKIIGTIKSYIKPQRQI